MAWRNSASKLEQQVTAYEIVQMGLAQAPGTAFQASMRAELQRRMLEWTADDWHRLHQQWQNHDADWVSNLCDTLSPSKHGMPCLPILMAIACSTSGHIALSAIDKLIHSQKLNATESALLIGALQAQAAHETGQHSSRWIQELEHKLLTDHPVPPIQEACEAAAYNRSQFAMGFLAACYYCQTVFAADLVSEYADGGETALCPHCGTDAVLPSVAAYDFSPAGLQALHEFWFI